MPIVRSKPFGGGWLRSPAPGDAYTAQLGSDIAWSTDFNIFTVSIAGGPAKSITATNKATDTGGLLSRREDDCLSRDGAAVLVGPLPNQLVRPRYRHNPHADGIVGPITWFDRMVAGEQIVARHGRRGRSPEDFRVDIATGRAIALVSDHYNSGISYITAMGGGSGPRIVFAQDSLTAPAEIYSANADGSDQKRLTHFNDERVTRPHVAPAEFHFAGAQGEQVQAWILKPVGFEEGRSIPSPLSFMARPQGALTTTSITAGTRKHSPARATPSLPSISMARPASARPLRIPSPATGAVSRMRT